MPSSVERVNKPIFYRKLRPIGINYPQLVSGSTRTSSRRKNQIGWVALCDRRSCRLSTWDCTRRTRLAQRKFRPARRYLRAAQTFSPSSLRSPCSRRYRRRALIILSYLIPDKPQSVSAKGSDHIEPGLVDVAYLTLHFGNNFIADFHVNWPLASESATEPDRRDPANAGLRRHGTDRKNSHLRSRNTSQISGGNLQSTS